MEWGTPVVQEKIEYDVNPAIYHIYESLEEAEQYARTMQGMNGG